MTTLNTDEAQAFQATQATYADLCLFKSTQPFEAMRAWIEALAAQQQALMTSCPRDKLSDAQIRLKQLIAMREALARPGEGGNGHVFS